MGPKMIDELIRNRTACQMRIRNEARWIRRSLERTFQIASRVAIFDDGSTDTTLHEAVAAVEPDEHNVIGDDSRRGVVIFRSRDGQRELHWIDSPFANDAVRPTERANEIRDRGNLWWYLKSNLPFEHVLCLDGDEWLSEEAIRTWPKVAAAMDAGADFVQLPFVYLWDGDDQQRIDGIYGPEVDGDGGCLTCRAFHCASPRHKRLRFPRAFSVQRLTPEELYNTRVEWNGTRSGLHCGSIPRSGFLPGGREPVTAFAEAPVIHAGYRDEAERQRKFEWYNKHDPPGTESNRFEGGYRHVIGQPDQHAPGPVKIAPWEDK